MSAYQEKIELLYAGRRTRAADTALPEVLFAGRGLAAVE
jgi:hypothetical protein